MSEPESALEAACIAWVGSLDIWLREPSTVRRHIKKSMRTAIAAYLRAEAAKRLPSSSADDR